MPDPIAYLPAPVDAAAPTAAVAVADPITVRYRALAKLAVRTCVSAHTRRVYAARLEEFLASGYSLTRDGVSGWLAMLRETQLIKPPTHNQCLSAVKRLADEAELEGLLEPLQARGISKLRGINQLGKHSGNWLTLAGAKALIAMPNRNHLVGKRDACILALLLGCGLRREEAALLTWRHYQQRDGRMCLVDINGKRGRIRSVPVIEWARRDLNAWMQVASDRGHAKPDDRILRRMTKLKRFGSKGLPQVDDRPLTSFGIWHVVRGYAGKLGMDKLTPHDLRRTMARLMRKAGAEWEQIQLMLGHSSITTTQMYVGSIEMDEGRAGIDLVQW